MSYEPTTWKSGDIVTSAKLNKLEQGVANAGGCLVVNVNVEGDPQSGATYTLDKTWQEIYDTVTSGTPVFLFLTSVENYAYTFAVEGVTYDGIAHYSVTSGFESLFEGNFSTNSATDYPSCNGGK